MMKSSFLCFFWVMFGFQPLIGQEQRVLFFPFHFDWDPMESLLIINLEKDPDSVYIGFEPQQFNDSINGNGYAVIGWRRDGKIDVYHESSLHLNPQKFSIAGAGLHHLSRTTFSKALVHHGQHGVKASFSFIDYYGRTIELFIDEQSQTKRNPFDLLAPMGDAAQHPHAMPLFYLYEFYFIRMKHTVYQVRINGKDHQADKMPFWLDGQRMLFSRYSTKPQLILFNPSYSGKLSPFSIFDHDSTVSFSDQKLHINPSTHHLAIDKLVLHHPVSAISLHFFPAFPNLLDVLTDTVLTGTFIISGPPSIGTVQGHYRIIGHQHYINLSLHPGKGWLPNPDRFFLRFLYRVAKPFKNWPKTYVWEADVYRRGDQFEMESRWTRIQ